VTCWEQIESMARRALPDRARVWYDWHRARGVGPEDSRACVESGTGVGGRCKHAPSQGDLLGKRQSEIES